jgi:hypothetical protein
VNRWATSVVLRVVVVSDVFLGATVLITDSSPRRGLRKFLLQHSADVERNPREYPASRHVPPVKTEEADNENRTLARAKRTHAEVAVVERYAVADVVEVHKKQTEDVEPAVKGVLEPVVNAEQEQRNDAALEETATPLERGISNRRAIASMCAATVPRRRGEVAC